MKTKYLLFFLILSFVIVNSYAQVTFQKTFGGTGVDYGSSIQQTNDGGFIISGYTYSFGDGNDDVYLIKTDDKGDTLWTKTLGGTGYDVGTSIRQTNDGYIITGVTTDSASGSNYDIPLIKTDTSGNKIWSKTFGGSGDDGGNYIQQTNDGGYIIAGYTTSFGAGGYDCYLLKTDANGNKVWSKTFGGAGSDDGRCVRQTKDGGYIIVGATESFGTGGYDAYIIKTDSGGNKLWSKTYGGTANDDAESVQQTNDGGYIIGGTTVSFGAGNTDIYLIKTDSSGSMVWSKTFGGTNNDYSYSVLQTSDGGYIINGFTSSFGVDSNDAYLIKTNSSGNLQWSKTFGGIGDDRSISMQQTNDGGYILTGSTNSFGAGNNDVYLIKTDSLGASGCNQGNPATVTTTPATQVTTPALITSIPSPTTNNLTTIVGNGGIVTALCSDVGINELNVKAMISIYPNPTSGIINILLDKDINGYYVNVFDVMGQKVYSEPFNGKQKAINYKLSAGIYLVQVTNGSETWMGKVLHD